MKQTTPNYRKKRRADRMGRLAEIVSLLYVLLQGWQILYRRKKTPLGEIDLVCKRRKTILFIEVKYRRKRRDIAQILPSPVAQTRLFQAAHFIFSNVQTAKIDGNALTLRFDIHIWTGFGRLEIYRNVALENTSWHFD